MKLPRITREIWKKTPIASDVDSFVGITTHTYSKVIDISRVVDLDIRDAVILEILNE